MIAARWAVLALMTGLALAALGGMAGDLQASGQRVMIAASVGVLAPLCWPGCAEATGPTAVRVGLWSAAAVALAATLQRLLGPSGQALAPILSTCALLLPILLLTHAVAAVVETRLRRKSDDAALARDVASRTAATGLALLGAVPLWLGPVADLLSARHDGLVDAIVGISPLTHLAVASGNDLLRNDWLYEHANLAALPVAYPRIPALAGCYGALCLVLGLVTLMRLRAGRMIGLSPSTHPIAENTP